ncbi:MAG: hypothetical protein MI862_00925 [Desulfobacterales bacterium]|nr:hypothetical protein [Desulfobacterales bacterium]
MGFVPSPAISNVPDAKRQEMTGEAYHSYAAGRNDRRQRSRRCRIVDQSRCIGVEPWYKICYAT